MPTVGVYPEDGGTITLFNQTIQYHIPEDCSDLNDLFYLCNIDINKFLLS